jgi:hypothetical protein
MLSVLREAKIAEMAQEVKACGKPRNVARITGGGKQEPEAPSGQVGMQTETKRKAGPRVAPTGTARAAGKKQK